MLYDPASGVRITPGRLTALVSSRPSDATEILDRLGRYTPSDATWGDIPRPTSHSPRSAPASWSQTRRPTSSQAPCTT
ncbi:hypothetical protein SVIOM342S_07789 [Streptomyces violaceorubidus]